MKRFLFFTATLSFFLMISINAMAVGLGVYGTGGLNFSSWYYATQSEKYTSNSNDYIYGGGLVIDTAVAKDMLFNYRFSGGYEQYVLKDPQTGDTSKPISRFSMTHTFGFGVWRTLILRVWVGPRIGLHYLRHRDSFWYFTIFFIPAIFPQPAQLLLFPTKAKVKIDVLGADVMLAFGLNINIGDLTTLFIDIGLGYAGNFNLSADEYSNGFGMDGKVGVMFRIGDTYVAQAASEKR
jgi:hypothetical protein